MWKKVKLGDICDFEGGSQPPKKEFVYEPAKGYVRFLQIRDFKSDKNITYIPVAKKNRLCSEEDILIGRYGASVGQILGGLSGAYNVALMKTIPNKELISKGWLHAYLSSTLFQLPLLEVSSRSAQNGFSKDDIYNFEVPLPPLKQQKSILAKLDSAFAEIDKNKLNIKNKIELSKKLFTKYLDKTFQNSKYKSIKIGDIIGVHSGGTPSTTNKNYWNGTIPWYSSRELNDYRTKDSVKKITNLGLKNSNAKIYPINTLLIGIYDTAAMKMSILHQEGTFNQAIVGIPPNSNFETEYLFFVLNYMKGEILLQRRGVRQMNLSLEKIKSINIPRPTLEEQRHVINSCNILNEHTKNLEKLLVEKLYLLNTLKNSILNQKLNNKAI